MSDEEEQEFAAPVLHGRRFEGQTIPVDVLKELESYQRLIRDVAKALFLARHPQRQRVPKGFGERLELSLRQIERGSAIPVLQRSTRPPKSGQTVLPLVADEFEQARDLIAAAVKAVANNDSVPDEFPRSVLGRFDMFGRTLRSDEAIELRRRRSTPGPRYDSTVRRQLVLLHEKSYSDSVDLVGRIYELDVEKGAFHIDADGRKVMGRFTPEHKAVLVEALADDEHTRVRLVGAGRFDARQRLEQIEDLEEVTLIAEGELTPADLRARAQEFSTLERGWLDGDAGDPLDLDAITRITDLLIGMYEEDEVPVPHLYPTPEGGVQAEWTLGCWELSATIDLSTGEAELDAVEVETGAGKNARASLYSAEGRSACVDFVTSFARRGRS